MTTTRPEKNARQGDWHPAHIIAELRVRRGLTLSKLAATHKVSRQYLSYALHKSAPQAEQFIAAAIGIPATTLWPSRFENGQHKPVKRGRPFRSNVDIVPRERLRRNGNVAVAA